MKFLSYNNILRLIFLFTSTLNCFAQQSNVDSLQIFLGTAKADTNKVKILNELCWEYKNSMPDKALKYGRQALQLATILLENSVSQEEVIHCKKAIAKCLNNIGVVYDYQGDYENALDHYLKALAMNEELNDGKSIAASLNNVGIIYYYQGNNHKAFDYYMQALKIRRELGDKTGIAGCLNNIGLLHIAMGNLSDDPHDYDKAITSFQQSLELKKELENSPDEELSREGKQGVARTLGNIGSVYKSRGNLSGNHTDYDKAIDYYMNSLKKFEELGDKKGITIVLNDIGDVYGIQGKYEKGAIYLHKSLNIAMEMGAKNEMLAGYQKLSEFYQKQNYLERAIEYYKLYSQLKDSLLNEENSKQLIEMQTKYESEKKQKEIDLLTELKISEARRQTVVRNFLIALLLLVLTFAVFLYYRYREKKRSNIVIAEKNEEITGSIKYAKQIQESILPEDEMKRILPDSFVLFKPKDIVSGDFYWCTENWKRIIIAAIDCTGHGVPGAFMSMIGNDLLNRSIIEKGIGDPAEILTYLQKGVRVALKQADSNTATADGMDVALCSIDRDKNTITFAGAARPLWLIKNNGQTNHPLQRGDFIEVKGDTNGIAGMHYKVVPKFTNHQIKINPGDTVYLSSDGFTDQFGGPDTEKFRKKRLKELLLNFCHLNMDEQKEKLNTAIENWRGILEQTDDIMVIGLRL